MMDLFKIITFVRFCFASAYVLQKDLGLPTEKLICLYKECIEMAKHCHDINTMVLSCIEFVLHSNSLGRHADSLRCLKEILPSAVGIPRYELAVHRYLSLTYYELKEFDNVVSHGKKWTEIARNTSNKEEEGFGYHTMRNAFLSLACYDDALDCGKKCLEIAQETDSAEGEMMAYVCIMDTYKRMQKHDDIILYAHKLLDCAMQTNDKRAMKTAYLELGRVHFYLNQYQDALDFGKKCIEIAREIEDRCGEVWAYLLMGQVHKALSDCDNAIIYCKKCIELAMTIGDKHAEARAYSTLGDIYYSMKKYDDAVSSFNKCVHIDKEDDEDKAFDVDAYSTLGAVNQSLEKYDEAILNFKQCIDIVNRIGRKMKTAAKASLCMGIIYLELKQYNDALYYSKKGMEMAQEAGDKRTEAEACVHLSNLYLTRDEKENAIQYGKKCLNLSEEIGDKEIQMKGHCLFASAYLDTLQLEDASLSIDAGFMLATELGDKEAKEIFKVKQCTLHAYVGFFDKENASNLPVAVKEFYEVPTCSEDDLLNDRDQAVQSGDKRKIHKAYIRLYRFYYSKLNDYEKTISCLEQLKKMDIDRSVNLFCISAIGNLYEMMGQNDMALRCFKEGLPTAESSSNNRQRSHFYHGIGQLLFSLERELHLAERYLREAIRCFEAIFTTLGSRDEFKISIFDKYIDSYKLLAILLVKGEQIEEALVVLDRCRARALKDLMMANYKMEQEESNDEHLEYSDVLALVSRNDFSIFSYSICFNVFLKFFLGKETPDILYYSMCPNDPNDLLETNVDTLLDEMGVREVVNCEDRSLDKEQDIQKMQKRSQEEYERFNQTTASLLNLNSKRGESNENSAETKGSSLEVLFDILKCDRILSSKQDEVVVLPDGPLYKVPFPALRDPRTGKYLSETKRIRLAPSLATLKHFQDFPLDQTSNAQPLIIGDPLVGKVMMDGEERDIEPLPGARAEAAEISVLLDTPALLTIHATKPAVLERLQQGASVVHIAAHGILSKATIVLAPSPEIRATRIPDEEDYMLTMADVQQAQVRAQLVVLSCCHSGRGEIRAEGVVGMCRAFLASGARAVVASLWAIDDDATFEFMQNFYLSLKDGKSASASLQEAMKELRNTTSYSKPKYWAPFFLMGDDVTIKF